MNNFSAAFHVVISNCERQSGFAEIYSFDALAKEINVPVHKPEIDLQHLQETGLIIYAPAGPKKNNYLTSFGRKRCVNSGK
jgi:hypothetical protein